MELNFFIHESKNLPGELWFVVIMVTLRAVCLALAKCLNITFFQAASDSRCSCCHYGYVVHVCSLKKTDHGSCPLLRRFSDLVSLVMNLRQLYMFLWVGS